MRNGGQGAPVRLGLCARLISFLLLSVLRRNCIGAVSAPCSPCWHFLQFKTSVFVHLYEVVIILLTFWFFYVYLNCSSRL